MNRWIFLYFAVWFGGTFWWVSSRFVDAEITPKWFFALFGAAVFCIACAALAFLPESLRKKGRFTSVAAAILPCAALQAAYALLQWGGLCDSRSSFPACGSFDNPAGLASALAFSIPFGFHLAENSQGGWRKAAWAATILVVVAIMASGSRSGILAVCAVCLVFFPMKWAKIRKPLALALVFVVAIASIFLYYNYLNSLLYNH